MGEKVHVDVQVRHCHPAPVVLGDHLQVLKEVQQFHRHGLKAVAHKGVPQQVHEEGSGHQQLIVRSVLRSPTEVN